MSAIRGDNAMILTPSLPRQSCLHVCAKVDHLYVDHTPYSTFDKTPWCQIIRSRMRRQVARCLIRFQSVCLCNYTRVWPWTG